MKEKGTDLKRAAAAHALRQCRLFSGVDSADLEILSGLVKPIPLDRGEYLFREGEPATGFYVVQQGSVSVHRVAPGGKEQIIHIFRPGDSFAEAVVAGEAGFPADARALEASSVLLVPRTAFLDLIARRPQMALWMVATMAQHLRTLVARLEDLTLKDVETRFASWLTRRLSCGKPGTVEIGNTKRVLAAELGTTSETLSRTFARFTELGLIAVKGRSIRVIDPAALAEMVRT